MRPYKVVIAFTYRNKRDGLGRHEAAMIIPARDAQDAKNYAYKKAQQDFDRVFVKSVELYT